MQNKSFDILKNRGEFRICYLGGSITEGAGASDKRRRWATQITDYLNSLGTEGTVFNEINAGIGGTDSAYGMMRLERDVVSVSPDAVFIDFSLNDAGLEDEVSIRMYEGIIRRLMGMEKVPYVICIGVVPNKEQSQKHELHKKIAKHYGIEYIDVKEAMDAAFGKAEPGVNIARDVLFRPDNVHPVEAGYDFYTEVIKNALCGDSFRVPCAESACSDYETLRGRFVNAREFAKCGEWTEHGSADWNAPNPGRNGMSLASSSDEAELSLEFSGKTLLLGCRFDREAGKIRVTIDGKSEIHDLYYETDNQPVIIVSDFSLTDTKHTLTLSPVEEKEVRVDFAAVTE